MKFEFQKFHGTGNDFIMVDNRDGSFSGLAQDDITLLCHRRFGIGADGFILIEEEEGLDFRMVYYNSDGRQGSMCGNGGRCAVVFAHSLGMGNGKEMKFKAIDGLHKASIKGDKVDLSMADVPEIGLRGDDYYLNTGSPHHVHFVDSVEDYPVFEEGRRIRNEVYGHEGSNVNFVSHRGGFLHVRTYERGVEDETYSCGTGVTASALAADFAGLTRDSQTGIRTPGGDLAVRFSRNGSGYTDIHLIGSAVHLFNGNWIL